jgi:hypothetical protein
MAYLLVALAALLALVLLSKSARRRELATTVIRAPSLGVLNLMGAAGHELLTRDLELIAPLFGTTRNSEEQPPRCDVLLLYCELESNGRVQRSARSLREIIRDSGASVVAVATNHSADAYVAAAPNLPFGQANLVMTLDRKGTALASFLAKLFRKMSDGSSMPAAWNELAPRDPEVNESDGPEAIFACERGQITFDATSLGVAAAGIPPRS